MDLPHHLQIINPIRGEESRHFHLFSLLPTELRLEIWQISLQRSRLINIELREGFGDEQSPCRTRNELGRIISGRHYSIVAVDGSLLHSKLLHVSSEARQAALQFYRVHLPCRFESGDKRGRGNLLFNPEYDMLHVKLCRHFSDFADFLHDLRAYDPRGVGLLNLALDHNDVMNLSDGGVPRRASRVAFKDTFSNLREVYFLCLENAGRIYFGPRGGIHTVPGFEIHRSRPIMSTIPTFDRLKRDPRGGMARDLSRVFAGTFDARKMLYVWLKTLSAWKIRHAHKKPEYRFLVANGWGSGRMANVRKISNRDSAVEWLREEEKRWVAGQERHAASIVRRGGKLPVESPVELERVPRPAIGFWLFPIGALGPLPGLNEESFPWESKRVVDMRQYWPELCLASMP